MMIDRYGAMPPHRISTGTVLWLTRIVLLAVFVLLCGMRLIHLGADTPLGVSANVGLYVDEGYKTLAPRNLILIGTAKIHPEDDYSGWFRGSPLTQWAYYTAFRVGGVSLESARCVSIAVFSLFLAVFLLVMKNRLTLLQLILGTLLLGLQSTLFFYSRVALFEIFIVAFLYIPLFLSLRWKFGDTANLAVFGLLGVGAVLLIKASSIIYFLPAFLAGASGCRFSTKRTFWLLAAGTALAGVFLGFDYWRELIGRLWWGGLVFRIFHFPLLAAAPVAVVGGYFCGLTGLLFKPATFTTGLYRRSLLAIVLLSPVLLALFPYHPLRYYVPILPAYILLILEWVKSKGWEKPASLRLTPGQWLAAWAFSLQACYQTLQAVNLYLPSVLPMNTGGGPEIANSIALKLFLPIALVASGILLWRRESIRAGKRTLGFFFGLLTLFLLLNSSKLFNFFEEPSFASRNVRVALRKIVPADALIAGDWAPFLTLGTSYRSLYVNGQFNREKIAVIRPTYFLYSSNKNYRQNRNSDETLHLLKGDPFVTLEAPRKLPGYFKSQLRLYPIEYKGGSAPALLTARKSALRK